MKNIFLCQKHFRLPAIVEHWELPLVFGGFHPVCVTTLRVFSLFALQNSRKSSVMELISMPKHVTSVILETCFCSDSRKTGVVDLQAHVVILVQLVCLTLNLASRYTRLTNEQVTYTRCRERNSS